MMAKNNIWECADPGTRGGTQLEVECLKGYGTIQRLRTAGLEPHSGRPSVEIHVNNEFLFMWVSVNVCMLCFLGARGRS